MSGSRRSFFRDLASAVASAKDATTPPEPEPMPDPPGAELTDAEIERYSRQLVLPEWGAAAQLALSEASVLVIGAGALGSPASARSSRASASLHAGSCGAKGSGRSG